MYWAEVSKTKRHGLPPDLLPLHEAIQQTGFVSIYGLPDATADWVRSSGAFRGLAALDPVLYSDTLVVDFDDNPGGAALLAADLRRWGIAFTRWDSGGRSVHFHIRTVPYEGHGIPAMHKAWMREWASTHSNTAVDVSIYQASGLWRLPGTQHEKTGRRKACLERHEGARLDVSEADPPVARQHDIVGDPVRGAAYLWRLALTPAQAGERRPQLFKLVAQARDLGWPIQDILKLATQWNLFCASPPLDAGTVRDKVEEILR